MWKLKFGASVFEGGVEFRVWAPRLGQVAVILPGERAIPMDPDGDGEFAVVVPGLGPGADYRFLTDAGFERPDPVSRWQPQGVHGPSRVVDPHGFPWTDQAWKGVPLRDYVIYELHTGTFTPQGTFEAIIGELPYLRELGITAIELMPVAEFPGQRNWGYDGVDLYAPHSTYGGPVGLKKLVDAAHRERLAVVLDVVYNHLGPEGNYLSEFAPFFTDAYKTPWGEAVNYDGPESDGVRRFFVDNAVYWLTEYHVDALRLDAIHGIYDFGARHILAELADAFHLQAQLLGRAAWLIAESDLNDVRVIQPQREGGYGLDAQWHDDFHHSLYAVLTGNASTYFADFGRLQDLGKAITEGFVYDGQRSRYRRRRHGSSSKDRRGEQFVVFTENHDQIANALRGNRPSSVASFEQQKLAATFLLCSPFIPLLFMGQEYAETAPFHYFTDHGDRQLADVVREGRKREFGACPTHAEFADPQDPHTFGCCKLNPDLRERPPHVQMLRYYRDLMLLRRQHACLSNNRKDLVRVGCYEVSRCMVVERTDPSGSRALLVYNFSQSRQTIPVSCNPQWSLAVWSGDAVYGGPVPQDEPPPVLGRTESLSGIALPGVSAAVYVA